MLPDDLIQAIHASPQRGVLAVTGGGSGAISALLGTPGASATVLEAVTPYSPAALAEWLGFHPLRACDAAAATALAMRSFQRSRGLDTAGASPRELFGVGCTASLATNRPKRGDHRAFVAVQTWRRTLVLSLEFEKGLSSRADEEQATAHAVIAAVGHALGIREVDLTRTPPGIEANLDDQQPPESWGQVLLGELSAAPVHGAPAAGTRGVCLFAGSFNPPHAGHRRIAELAAELTGRTVLLELSLTNVDKPAIDFVEARRRVDGLDDAPTWLTAAPTFVEKAALAPNVTFAVGADTLERIADTRYYNADRERRDAAIDRLDRLGAQFLVFGRVSDGRFEGLDALDLPTNLRRLCQGVPEEAFRVDVSSTELRNE